MWCGVLKEELLVLPSLCIFSPDTLDYWKSPSSFLDIRFLSYIYMYMYIYDISPWQLICLNHLSFQVWLTSCLFTVSSLWAEVSPSPAPPEPYRILCLLHVPCSDLLHLFFRLTLQWYQIYLHLLFPENAQYPVCTWTMHRHTLGTWLYYQLEKPTRYTGREWQKWNWELRFW